MMNWLATAMLCERAVLGDGQNQRVIQAAGPLHHGSAAGAAAQNRNLPRLARGDVHLGRNLVRVADDDEGSGDSQKRRVSAPSPDSHQSSSASSHARFSAGEGQCQVEMVHCDFAGVGGQVQVYCVRHIFRAKEGNTVNVDKKEIYDSRAGAAGASPEATTATSGANPCNRCLSWRWKTRGRNAPPNCWKSLPASFAPHRVRPPARRRPTSTRFRRSSSRRIPATATIERRIKSIIRWNAMAMVVKANSTTNVGGHISTFASAATLYEVGV